MKKNTILMMLFLAVGARAAYAFDPSHPASGTVAPMAPIGAPQVMAPINTQPAVVQPVMQPISPAQGPIMQTAPVSPVTAAPKTTASKVAPAKIKTPASTRVNPVMARPATMASPMKMNSGTSANAHRAQTAHSLQPRTAAFRSQQPSQNARSNAFRKTQQASRAPVTRPGRTEFRSQSQKSGIVQPRAGKTQFFN